MYNNFVVCLQKTREDEKSFRRKEKEKAKAEEKNEKRRIKEEKVKKLAEEREKKKHKSKSGKPGSGGSTNTMQTLGDFIQSEHSVPLILEKYIQFIEHEGLDSEGIYRVPGNRAHVDLLFQKFDEGVYRVAIRLIAGNL